MPRFLLDAFAVWSLRLAAVLVAPLLLFTARTWRGRAVGVLAAAGWGLLACWVVAEWTYAFSPFVSNLPGSGPQPPAFGITPVAMAWAHAIALLLTLSAVFWFALAAAFLLFTLPEYRSDTPGLRSVFLGPLFLHRVQLALLNEPDWLWLGVLLVTRFDFRVKREERLLIRDTIRHHLDELATEHRVLPPALPLAVWGRITKPDHGHRFLYRPEAAPGERLGLLVFLHGHGGNALLFPHLLRPFAERWRFAVVCPSFGYGNWEHPHAAGCVERTLRYVAEHCPEVDPARVLLMGLSQGGAGVGQAAAAMPERFAGLVFVSPTMEPAVLNGEAFGGKRVLVVHGDADRHVGLKSVLAGVEALEGAGADVTVHRTTAGTHFLLFSEADEVMRLVGEWAADHSDHVESDDSP